LAEENTIGNAFGEAEKILTEIAEGKRAPLKPLLRHWEWGRLYYLCNLDQDTWTMTDSDHLETAAVTDQVEAVAVSHDGNLVIAGSSAGPVAVKAWKRASNDMWEEVLRYPPRHDDKAGSEGVKPIYAVAISEDGRCLAAAGGRGDESFLKIWQLEDGAFREAGIHMEARAHHGPIQSVAFTKDGRRLLTSGLLDAATEGGPPKPAAKLWTWNPNGDPRQDGQSQDYYHWGRVRSARFSPDDEQRFIVTASDDGIVRVWCAASAQELERFHVARGPAYAAAFSPDGRHVLAAAEGGRVYVWQTRAATILHSTAGQPERIAETVSKNHKAATEKALMTSVRAEIDRSVTAHWQAHNDVVLCVDFTVSKGSSGDREGEVLLITAGRDNTIKVWRFAEVLSQQVSATRGPVKTLRGHGSWVSSCSASGNADLLVSGSYDGTIKLWDFEGYQESQILEVGNREVLGLAFSPTGDRVLAPLSDRTAVMWNIETQETRFLREGHEILAYRAAPYPDRSKVVTTAGDNTTRIWDTKTGAEVNVLKGTGRRGALALYGEPGATAPWILTGSDRVTPEGEWKALLWNPVERVDSQYECHEFGEHRAEVTVVAISRNGQLLLTADASGAAFLWEANAGLPRVVSRFYHSAPIQAAAFLPSGDYVLTASIDGELALWATRGSEGQLGWRRFLSSSLAAMDVAPDGKSAIVASTVWPLQEERTGQRKDPVSTVSLWDIESGTRRVTAPELSDRYVTSVSFHPSGAGATIVCSDGDNEYFEELIWDLDDKRPRSLRDKIRPIGAVFSATYVDASRLLTIGASRAQLWNLERPENESPEEMHYKPHGTPVACADFSSDGKYVVTGGSEYAAKVWDAETGMVLHKLPGLTNRHVRSVAFSPDNKKVLLATDNGDDRPATVFLWDWQADPPQPQPLVRDDGSTHRKPVHHAIFSPCGNYAVTCSNDRTVAVWDVQTRQLCGELDEQTAADYHEASVLCAAFCSGADWLITGGEDNQALVWNFEDLKNRGPGSKGEYKTRPVARMRGHAAPITSVSVSPDGNRIVTGSEDRTARLWNAGVLRRPNANQTGTSPVDRADHASLVEDLTEIMTLADHDREVTAVAFSPNGRSIGTAGRDGRVVVRPSSYVAPGILLPETEREEGGKYPFRDAVLMAPGVRDFGSVRLEVKIEPADSDEKALDDFLRIGMDGNGNEIIKVSHGAVTYDFKDGRAPQTVGTFESAVEGKHLNVVLTKMAKPVVVEELLRLVVYQPPSMIPSDRRRRIHVTLTDIESGDDGTESEQPRQSADASIYISLKYRPPGIDKSSVHETNWLLPGKSGIRIASKARLIESRLDDFCKCRLVVNFDNSEQNTEGDVCEYLDISTEGPEESGGLLRIERPVEGPDDLEDKYADLVKEFESRNDENEIIRKAGKTLNENNEQRSQLEWKRGASVQERTLTYASRKDEAPRRIGTFSGGLDLPLKVTFGENATRDAVEAVLHHVTYELKEDVTYRLKDGSLPAQRKIRLTLKDFEGRTCNVDQGGGEGITVTVQLEAAENSP
jgi:WD40 repeat protein